MMRRFVLAALILAMHAATARGQSGLSTHPTANRDATTPTVGMNPVLGVNGFGAAAYPLNGLTGLNPYYPNYIYNGYSFGPNSQPGMMLNNGPAMPYYQAAGPMSNGLGSIGLSPSNPLIGGANSNAGASALLNGVGAKRPAAKSTRAKTKSKAAAKKR